MLLGLIFVHFFSAVYSTSLYCAEYLVDGFSRTPFESALLDHGQISLDLRDQVVFESQKCDFNITFVAPLVATTFSSNFKIAMARWSVTATIATGH
jgi:hypothetical protein